MGLIFVFSGKNAIRMAASFSWDLKEVKKFRPVLIYPHKRKIKFLLKVFFWDGTDLKFEIGHKGEK